MTNGLLWFESKADKPLKDIVVEAALYFRRKFGRAPELCLVNPNMMTEQSLSVDAPENIKVLVKPWRSILPKHIWIGIEDESLLPESMQEPA